MNGISIIQGASNTTNIRIEHNTVSAGYDGVYLYHVDSVFVSYNIISGGFRGLAADGTGIGECHHNSFSSGGGQPFLILACYDPENGWLRVENNLMITINSGTPTFNGCSFTNTNRVEFINNTVYFNSNVNYQAAFYLNNVDSCRIYNNVMMNNGNGYALNYINNVYSEFSDNNVLFTNGTLFAPGTSSLSQWQTINQIDFNSISVNPQFVNIPNNFHPTNPLVDGLAVTGYGIMDDLIGVPRHPQYPDPGCYEFSIAPVANLGADQMLCGDSLTLAAGNNGSYYLWSTGETTQSITVTSSATYWVRISNLAGIASDTISVVLNSYPTLVISGNDSICAGDTTQLIASSNATTFSWLPITGLDNPSVAVVDANPTSAVTYTVTVTHSNGCSTSASVGVTVIALPNAQAGTDQSICMGNSVQIGTGPAFNCNWSPSTGLNSSTDCQPIASPSTSETYVLRITDAFGCVDTDTVQITVNSLPSVAACCSQIICPNDTVILTATSSASNISWSPSAELSSSSGNMVNAFPSSTTTLVITATDSNGCASTDFIVLTVYPAPPIPVISQSGIDLMSSQASGIQWYLNGNIINGATSQYYTPVQNGNYTVIHTDSNGCSSTSPIYYFGTVNIDQNNAEVPTCFYNADQNKFNFTGITPGTYQLQIYNQLGQIIVTDQIILSQNYFDYSFAQSTGVYLINLNSTSNLIVMKAIIPAE
ncbi:MAG: T9SS type A sorting domain-containing protein [Bacteroidota bacterium]|nr:T9SS type A sorting domain-containing protein [Bacteroidota bacterium]